MVLVVVSLAAVALLTSAEVAQAGAVRQVFTYSSFPYTNPCNGELVLASGIADLVTNTVSNAGVELRRNRKPHL
jgi:hypothetical protein